MQGDKQPDSRERWKQEEGCTEGGKQREGQRERHGRRRGVVRSPRGYYDFLACSHDDLPRREARG